VSARKAKKPLRIIGAYPKPLPNRKLIVATSLRWRQDRRRPAKGGDGGHCGCPASSANKGTSMLCVGDCAMSDGGLLITGAQDKVGHH